MEKKQNVPALRFQGFSGEWEKTTVGKIFEVTRGETLAAPKTSPTQNPVMNYPVYSSQTKNNGLMGYYSEYLFENAITWTTDGANAGTVRFRKGKFYCTNVCGVLLSKQGYANTFMAEALNKVVWKHVSKVGNPKLMNNVMKEISIHAPKTIDEQNELAEYIEKLDLNIFNRMQKIRKLQQFRQAMLAKLFPREGAAEPELRFRGFSGKWNVEQFSKLVFIERGGSPRPIDSYITNADDGLNWVKIGDAPKYGIYITHTAEKIKPVGLSMTRQVYPGDLILSNSMSFGRPYIMAITGCIHDGWLLIRNSNKIFDLKFLYCLLGSPNVLKQYKALASGSTVNNLNKALVGSVIIQYPPMEEQKRIGKFFDQLDSYISLQQKKLDRMQRLKAALLEKLFV